MGQFLVTIIHYALTATREIRQYTSGPIADPIFYGVKLDANSLSPPKRDEIKIQPETICEQCAVLSEHQTKQIHFQIPKVAVRSGISSYYIYLSISVCGVLSIVIRYIVP